MKVYYLCCKRFYGQLEGLFISKSDIIGYLKKHPWQRPLPEDAFENKNYWEYCDANKEIYSNYYFSIHKIEYLGILTKSQTFLDYSSEYYVLVNTKNYASTPILSSSDETQLKKFGLKKLFEESTSFCSSQQGLVYTDRAWLKSILRRPLETRNMDVLIEHASPEEIEKIWEERINSDRNATVYHIKELGRN